MALTAAEESGISVEFCEESYVRRATLADLGVDDIKAAAVALDGFLTTNFAVLNAVLPLPFRTTATAAQKLRLFKAVVNRMELRS